MSFRVNMTEQEAKSQDREPLPIGKYHFKITDVSLEYTKAEAKHPNKPYYNFEFTVQDSPGPWQKFAGRKDWTNAMLFEPALYTISQILKAIGFPIPEGGGEVDIPDATFFLGKDLMGRRASDPKQMEEGPDGKKVARVQLRGFSKYTDASGNTPNSTPTSVLP